MNPESEKKGPLRARLLVVLGAILFVIVAVAYFFYGLEPAAYADGENGQSGAIQFKIARGEGFREIGAHLSQQAITKSIAVFKLYSLFTGTAQKFQPWDL